MAITLFLFIFALYGAYAAAVEYIGTRPTPEVYGVTFGEEGGSCTPGVPAFHYETGKVLECRAARPGSGSGKVKGLPGFTSKEENEVFSLVGELARDGLTAGERERVHERVREISASLPPSRRYNRLEGIDTDFFGIKGPHQILAGLSAVIVSSAVGLWNLIRSKKNRSNRLREKRTPSEMYERHGLAP